MGAMYRIVRESLALLSFTLGVHAALLAYELPPNSPVQRWFVTPVSVVVDSLLRDRYAPPAAATVRTAAAAPAGAAPEIAARVQSGFDAPPLCADGACRYAYYEEKNGETTGVGDLRPVGASQSPDFAALSEGDCVEAVGSVYLRFGGATSFGIAGTLSQGASARIARKLQPLPAGDLGEASSGGWLLLDRNAGC